MRAVLIACLFALGFALPAGSTGVTGELVEYGTYEIERGGSTEAKRTATGNTQDVTSYKLIEKTDRVVGMLQRHFGIIYKLNAALPPGEKLVYRAVHPAIVNPQTGDTWTVSEWDSAPPAPGVGHYIGYSFDYTWEIAEGEWALQVVYRGTVIVERKFQVTVPLN